MGGGGGGGLSFPSSEPDLFLKRKQIHVSYIFLGHGKSAIS